MGRHSPNASRSPVMKVTFSGILAAAMDDANVVLPVVVAAAGDGTASAGAVALPASW